MASPGKDNFRMKSYKNNALNPQEMRRRREEEGIQLRKQKREEQVSILGGCSLFSTCGAVFRGLKGLEQTRVKSRSARLNVFFAIVGSTRHLSIVS